MSWFNSLVISECDRRGIEVSVMERYTVALYENHPTSGRSPRGVDKRIVNRVYQIVNKVTKL